MLVPAQPAVNLDDRRLLQAISTPQEMQLHDTQPCAPTTGWRRRELIATALLGSAGASLTAGCTTASTRWGDSEADERALVSRMGWDADRDMLAALRHQGRRDFIAAQLYPAPRVALPPDVQTRIDAMTLAQRPMDEWVGELARRHAEARRLSEDADRRAALQLYQQDMNRLAQDTATRSLLRALYSPQPLQEQMTWFWCNHFSVYQGKAELRAMVGDYEDRLRPLALGRFSDLLIASATHAAMLRYLDNAQNAARRLNENYARELLELHTLGARGGYTQRDVQEMARVLTGLGVRFGEPASPSLAPALQALHWRQGGVEFNPARHDRGAKYVLGQHVNAGQGWDEILAQLRRLADHPATARHVSTQLARYLAADAPDPALVDHMARAFRASDGDIAHTLQALFDAPQFPATLGRKFKHPWHYLVSSVRLLYDGRSVPDTAPLLGALDRMGQGLFKRQTPDGYPLDAAAWSGSGQMAARFDVARALVERAGNGAPSATQASLEAHLPPSTRRVLDAAASPKERQLLLLCAPSFQYR